METLLNWLVEAKYESKVNTYFFETPLSCEQFIVLEPVRVLLENKDYFITPFRNGLKLLIIKSKYYSV